MYRHDWLNTVFIDWKRTNRHFEPLESLRPPQTIEVIIGAGQIQSQRDIALRLDLDREELDLASASFSLSMRVRSENTMMRLLGRTMSGTSWTGSSTMSGCGKLAAGIGLFAR